MSGGMDSISIAWWKRPENAIFVDYGQKPAPAERDAGFAACRAMKIRYEQVKADCSALGSGDMAGTAPSPHAPVSEWWPFRNQLILTLAGAGAFSGRRRRSWPAGVAKSSGGRLTMMRVIPRVFGRVYGAGSNHSSRGNLDQRPSRRDQPIRQTSVVAGIAGAALVSEPQYPGHPASILHRRPELRPDKILLHVPVIS